MECVGNVDSGLTSMSWSPDEELVILTTGQYLIKKCQLEFQKTEKQLVWCNFDMSIKVFQ